MAVLVGVCVRVGSGVKCALPRLSYSSTPDVYRCNLASS